MIRWRSQSHFIISALAAMVSRKIKVSVSENLRQLILGGSDICIKYIYIMSIAKTVYTLFRL